MHPFELGLLMKPSALSAKVSIPHLLLNEHLLYRDPAVINCIDLARDRPALVTSCQRPISRGEFSASSIGDRSRTGTARPAH